MRRLAATVLTVTALAATPGMALGPVSFGPNLAGAGWKDLTFRNLNPAKFSAEGQGTLRVEADQAVSVLWRPLPSDFSQAATASWRWRVDQGVPATDLGRRGQDDRSIALYFLFADDPAAAENPPQSLRAAMRRGRALIYVWGGDAAENSVVTSPGLLGRAQMVVKQPAPGPAGQWVAENVDLRADFRRAFGREPGPLVGLGVSSDSDNTGGRTIASLSDLVIQ
ncbi:MAG: DUF3047 domain-containing protein [Pseudomonadota bacterium]